jgi:chromosomal replication initiator protein
VHNLSTPDARQRARPPVAPALCGFSRDLRRPTQRAPKAPSTAHRHGGIFDRPETAAGQAPHLGYLFIEVLRQPRQGWRTSVPEIPPAPLDTDLTTTWDGIRRELRAEVPDFTFHIWLDPLELAARRGGRLFVRAPDHIRTWVEQRYLPLLTGAAGRVLGSDATLEIVDGDWRASDDTQHSAHVASPPGDESFLNPKYTFDQFVIGDGNRLAHGAALAVAEQPGQTYNPLFIHGAPGLGKTHLLHAIGNYVAAYGGGLTVRYATVEMFTSEFTTAIRNGGNMSTFRERFRHADVLLIDDVQFLADKLRTEEEFFHTFNALYESGSQLVLTSDRRPADIDALEARLRERFACGLIAELEPPSTAVRLAILRTRARLDALHGVPDETLAEIAAHVTSSIRALEGALIRVVAYASLRGETPTPELARTLLARLYPRPATAAPTLEDIQIATAEALHVPREALLAHDRRPKVSFARQVAMYLSRELTDESLPAIGRGFGGRNHSTVMHAHRRIAASLTSDADTARAVDGVRGRLDQPT